MIVDSSIGSPDDIAFREIGLLKASELIDDFLIFGHLRARITSPQRALHPDMIMPSLQYQTLVSALSKRAHTERKKQP